MSRRSKREMAPPPQPSQVSSLSIPMPPAARPESSGPGCLLLWWCGRPVPQQAMPPWWHAASCGGGAAASSSQSVQKDDIDSDPKEWGVDNRPPGGFLSYFNHPWSQSLSQPIPPHLVNGNRGKGSPAVSASESHRRRRPLINLDNDENDANGARIDIRLKWTPPEEVRLVVAWCNNSNDPINGNCKKTEQYWGDVADEYSSTTPPDRRRTSKQLKDHFLKIKKKVTWFCSSWKEAVSIWPSGHSDDQIMEKAEAIYEEYKDGKFTLKHCWKILRDEPKFQVLLEEGEQSNKRNLDTEGSVGEFMPNLDTEHRPPGNKKAKKESKREAKKCPSQMDDVLQQLTKLQGTNESREKMLETQKHVSGEKLESSRLNHLAAKENAKSAMLETYRALSMKDTSAMPDDVRAEHLAFMRCVRESIFGKPESALKGQAPQVQFSVNGRQYNTGYYLADGIYPEWAAFVKSIKAPQMEKHKLYALNQEGCRKDIERAFGVLQSRFNIVRRPSRLWKRKSIGRIMKACVILHNMIVKDEKEMVKFPIDMNEQGGSSIALPPEVQRGGGPIFSEIIRRRAEIHHQPTHKQLKKDLIEHIWQKFANRRNN